MTTEIRDARETRGVLGGDQRADRNRHVDRGQYLNYYDELGFSSTAEGKDAMMAQEAEFQGGVTEQRGILGTAQSSVDTGYAGVATAQSELDASYKAGYSELQDVKFEAADPRAIADSSWNSSSHTSSLFKITTVYSPEYNTRTAGGDSGNPIYDPWYNTKTSNTYYLPPDMAKQVVDNFGSGTKVVGDTVYMSSDAIPGSLNDLNNSVHTLYNTYKDTYYSTVYGEVAKANDKNRSIYDTQMAAAYDGLNTSYATGNEQLSAASSSWDTQQGEITTATNELNYAVTAREGEWTALRSDYQDKLQNMREIFGGLSIEEG